MKGPKNGPGWLLGIIAIGWAAGVLVFDPVSTTRRQPRKEVLEPAPSLEWTTDAGGALPFIGRALPGKLPPLASNQKRAGTCDPEGAQVEIEGGCWVKTETRPPCPMGKQWEHEGKCWLPVAKAAPVPTSGDLRPPGVANQ